MQPGQQGEQDHDSGPGPTNRQDDGHHNGSPPSALVLQILTASEDLLATSGNYEAEVHLDQAAKQELQWWKHELLRWNGRPLQPPSPDLTIETDASSGLGCSNRRSEYRGCLVRGGATESHQSPGIAGGVLQTFTKERTVCTYKWTTRRLCAIYINHMGGTRSPCPTQPTSCRSGAWTEE